MNAQRLSNLVQENLQILFVGINPGLRSGEIGHHFAGRSNRFWKFLFESGLTTSKYDPQNDADLLAINYGITNIVPRVTATAAELTTTELQDGARQLKKLIEQYHPKIVACLGKVVYQHLSGRKKFDWGIQEDSVVAGVVDFVIPNPSGLNRMPVSEQLEFYRELREMKELQ